MRFFLFFYKACCISEWPQYGVTWNSSGIRNLSLSWVCFLLRVAGIGLAHHLQESLQVWLMGGAKPCSNWPNTGYGSIELLIKSCSLHLFSLLGGRWCHFIRADIMISCLPWRHWLFSDPNLVCNILPLSLFHRGDFVSSVLFIPFHHPNASFSGSLSYQFSFTLSKQAGDKVQGWNFLLMSGVLAW